MYIKLEMRSFAPPPPLPFCSYIFPQRKLDKDGGMRAAGVNVSPIFHIQTLIFSNFVREKNNKDKAICILLFLGQNWLISARAGEPEPGVIGSLEPEPLKKETRSRSRLEKKSGALGQNWN